ncbi:unnamed protein product [Adineta ricciae]|uniref:Uncharacterized protein n=1 Tax=Adineta ricciae TaxID=249248 RepID=A0A815CK37_ADIRI|nr:unnamed protein product [Adineta ricciae]
MYSIRPHSSGNLELNLPTSMYSVRPIIEQTTPSESALEGIQKRQDALLEKIEYLYNQIRLYQDKASTPPSHEEFVVHLSAKNPSAKILDTIRQFHDNQLPNLSSSNNANRSLSIIWADENDLSSMFHSHMRINDEHQIVNLLSHHLTNMN